ncbi:MAG TPA: tetratricopeptide repeat protein, partial [Thermoanaerobaculia bacterium]|nr:tetratricopeptide repeat protein [Thermoanaerobaculia bacterium]
ADPMGAIDAVRHQVRGAVAVRVGDEVDGFLEGEERPPKYEAYAEYLLGEEKFGIDYDSAEAHYRKALEIDPDFVMPRIVLACSFRNRSRWPEAAAEIAILERRRSSLSRYYRAILDMWREQLAGRMEGGLAGVREYARLAPADLLAQLDVACSALLANRPREAEEACRAPAAWDLLLTPARPWGATWFRVHGDSLHALGRHEEELATVRKGRSIYPTRSELLRAEVRALVPLGRNNEVDRLVDKGLDRAAAGELPESLLLEAAAELRGHGRGDDARRMADRAASNLLERPEEKRSREEREALVRALLAAERWLEALPFLAKLEKERPGEDVTWMGLRAVAAQRSGDRDAASRLDEALRRLDRPYLFGKHHFARAGLAAHRGERQKAVELLSQALAQGTFSEEAGASFFAHRAFELAPLLGYPPFEELIKPKG